MKTKTLFSFFILLYFFSNSSSLFSQDRPVRMLLGIESGITYYSMRAIEKNKYYSSKTGFTTGVSFEYFLNKVTGLKSGLYFERKSAEDGGMYTDINNYTTGFVSIHYKYNYLVVPVLFSVRTKGKSVFYGYAGPFLNFLMKSTVTYSGDTYSTESTNNITRDTKFFDIALGCGIGTNIPLSEKLIFNIDLRGNVGLTEPIINYKTSLLGILAGIKYKI